MLLTPLEQFQIISVFSIKIFYLDFSLTNMLIINAMATKKPSPISNESLFLYNFNITKA